MAKNAAPISSKLPYVPEFDGLRALAVFFVVARHTLGLPGGFIGVDMFFVLSGFLITRILVSEFESTGNISFIKFYARRCLRLMPALWLFLFVFVVASLIYGGDHKHNLLLGALSAGLYVMNWTEALNIGSNRLLRHTWSLAMEEQFYIIWPLLLCLVLKNVRRSSVWLPVFLALAASAAWRVFLVYSDAAMIRVYFGFDTRVETLLYGCLMAVLPADRLATTTRRFWYVPILFLFLCLFLISLPPLNSPIGGSKTIFTVGFSLIAACAAWAIVLILEYRTAFKIPILSWRPVVYLGRISYGIYLWHYPISRLNSHIPAPLNFIITGTVSVLIASASFHFVEARALRLKARFTSASAQS